MRRNKIRTVIGIFVCGFASIVSAANYPEREIQMVVGVPPGSAADLIARVLGPVMREKLQQTIVIENRPGADSIVGTGIIQRARPDGYHIGMVSPSFAFNPTIYPKTANYDPVVDFTPIGLVATGAAMVLVQPNSDIKNLDGLIAAAQGSKKKLNFGTAGGIPRMAGEMFSSMANLDLVHVMYRGAGESFNDLMGGRIDLVFSSLSAAKQLVLSGRMRAIGVTSAKRDPDFPDVPAISEILPGYQAVTWWGIVGPANIPQSIVKHLSNALVASIQDPTVKEHLERTGVNVTSSTPDEFGEFIRAEAQKWSPIAQRISASDK